MFTATLLATLLFHRAQAEEETVGFESDDVDDNFDADLQAEQEKAESIAIKMQLLVEEYGEDYLQGLDQAEVKALFDDIELTDDAFNFLDYDDQSLEDDADDEPREDDADDNPRDDDALLRRRSKESSESSEEETEFEDGKYCLLGLSCKKCKNKASFWYGKKPVGFRCGTEAADWEDGTYCLAGTSCKRCKNEATWWFGKHPNGFRCGTETEKFEDGTLCFPGLSCKRCKNKATWWYGKHPNGYRCGAEKCWTKGKWCAKGFTCDKCCNGHKIMDVWWNFLDTAGKCK